MFEKPEPDETAPPLTKEAAAKIKLDNPPLNVWGLVRWQGYGLLAFAALVLILTQDWGSVASLLWGGMAVLLPGALFARAITAHMATPMHSGKALLALGKWELLKIVLTIGMLLVAPVVINGLNWLVLLAGFVVTMKLYWLACFWVIKNSRSALKMNGN